MDALEETKPIPFEKGLKHIEAFLNLEKAMYGEALNIVYDIKTKEFKLPILTVQPIIENAIRHGIGKKEGGGTLTLSTDETEHEFIIIVADDGVGYNEHDKPDDRQPHIGINNVRQRLASQCGGTLEIKGRPGEGTTAKIIIPKKAREK